MVTEIWDLLVVKKLGSPCGHLKGLTGKGGLWERMGAKNGILWEEMGAKMERMGAKLAAVSQIRSRSDHAWNNEVDFYSTDSGRANSGLEPVRLPLSNVHPLGCG